MTYFLNIFLRDSSRKPVIVKEAARKRAQESLSFFFGIFTAALLFACFRCYPHRRTLCRGLAFFLHHFDNFSSGSRAEKMAGSQNNAQEAFLKTYQPEIIATLICLLHLADISTERYFGSFENKENWPFFQSLIGNISLMILEQSRLPDNAMKELAQQEVLERYIPKLLQDIRLLKTRFH